MTKLKIKSKEDIIERYKSLRKDTKEMLTDYYNMFLGLRQIAYGEDWQIENALTIVNDRLNRGDSPFNQHCTRTSLDKKLEEDSITKDLEHISELDSLIEYVNKKAEEKELTPDVAKEVYDNLIPFLYGKYCKDVRK
tara:strand:- start:1232 stop:1642 length:411 start_codon:yes stop_codon:yes gene_type:complete